MFFSIVVPLYNKSYSICRCIDSILSQDFTNYEVIVVNDGSIDESVNIIENSYQSEIDSGIIKLINQSNQGVSVARNKGVEISISDYVCFLDADDEWKPGFLNKMVALIEDYPNANLYSLAHMTQKEGSKLIKPKHGLPDSHRGYVEDFFEGSSKGSIANSSKVCVKKQSLISFDGFPEGVVAGEDIYVWIRLALKGEVACDMSYLSIVHQEADHSRNSRKNSVPFPLVYFSKNNEVVRSKSLNKYLFSIFYKHFLYSLVSLKPREAMLRMKVYMRIYL
ncbi:glycosyltransferase family 2 protein [Psychrobacter proteolyticus]|uniref:glycosyltransferase family 2 protein n=1 Tax=Psychrobacter proteolyticus TaxID=147825 RepID=UPI0013B417F6|nr:glycosyltransferase family 2 protein [Psychrobacter proteolyticus]